MLRNDQPRPTFVNVKDYGAYGDGSHADYPAISRAITAAGVSGHVYFPFGNYHHSTGLQRLAGQVFRGDGIGATTLSYTGTGTAIKAPTPGVRSYRGGVRDLTLDTDTAAIGLDLDSVSLAHIQNLEVTGFSDKGIQLKSSVSGGCVYNRFYDAQVQGATIGVYIGPNSTNANKFFGGRTNVCDTGVWIEDSNENSFFGFEAESGDVGYHLECSLAGLADYNAFFGCRAEANATYGWDIADANVRHTQLFSEWIGSNGTDIHDLGTKTMYGLDWYRTAGVGTIVTDHILAAPSIALSSGSGQIIAGTGVPLYCRGNSADSAGAVGNWYGNNPTLTNADSYPLAVCADTAVTHAVPVAKIRVDGAYLYAALGIMDIAGTGSPEGAVAAPVGSTFRRSNGGAGTSFYVKESGGSGNTGWVGK